MNNRMMEEVYCFTESGFRLEKIMKKICNRLYNHYSNIYSRIYRIETMYSIDMIWIETDTISFTVPYNIYNSRYCCIPYIHVHCIV